MFKFTCSKCGAELEAYDNGAMPGSKEKEPIICPECKNNCGEHMANGVWVVRVVKSGKGGSE